LVAKDKNATVALDRAIHELLGRRIGGGLSPPVPLPRAGRRPLLAYPAKLESMTANALADCQAVVILIDPDNVSRPPQAALQAAFGLSEAEARLAARLASGEALEVVAEQFGIAKETGRSQFSQRPACIGKPNWWRCLHRCWDGSNKIFTPENLRSANTQSVFKGFAEHDVSLGHVRRYVAMLKERQNLFEPGGMLDGLVSPGALRNGALTSGVY
jgi:hypothetical protein